MIGCIFLNKENPDFDIVEANCNDRYDEPFYIKNKCFRNDEKLFYNNLREVSNLLDIIVPFCFKRDKYGVCLFYVHFPYINE